MDLAQIAAVATQAMYDSTALDDAYHSGWQCPHITAFAGIAVAVLNDHGLLVTGDFTRHVEWAVRVDKPHPRRMEQVGDYLKLSSEQHARYGPRVHDGWVPVSRRLFIEEWQER